MHDFTTTSTNQTRRPATSALERIVATAMVVAVVIGGLILSPTVRTSAAAFTNTQADATARADALPVSPTTEPTWSLKDMGLSLLADASMNPN